MLVRFVIIQRMSTSTPLRLCLVRHGETDWNAARRLQGHLDIELNPLGLDRPVSWRLAWLRMTLPAACAAIFPAPGKPSPRCWRGSPR